ncbi:MAG: transposase [Clostridia bacterium]|nr:transposase [Clostridia bacterium]
MFKSDIMPRQARKQSASGIYRIMLRGINQQVIFKCDEDKEKFLQTLNHYKAISEYRIFANCLMSNHVHLLIKVEKENLDLIKRDKYLKLCREKGI